MRKLPTGPVRFVGSFPAEPPPATLPEVAFAGRSNVGKSSALNTLLGAHGLARVSKTPGRTQALNFFDVAGAWLAVDLPGYGFAKVGKGQRRAWKGLVESYLATRETLRLVIALADSRHEAQESDRVLVEGLREMGRPFLVVATKIDAVPRAKRAGHVAALARGLDVPLDGIVPWSSPEGTGRDALRDVIANAVAGG